MTYTIQFSDPPNTEYFFADMLLKWYNTKKDQRELKRSCKRRERQAWLDDWDGEW